MRDAFHGNIDSLLPLLRQTFDGIALLTPQPWRLAFANPTLATWLGRPADELRGELLEEILSAAPFGELWKQIEQVWQGNATDAAVMVYLRNDMRRVAPLEARLCRVVVGDEPLLGDHYEDAGLIKLQSAQDQSGAIPLPGCPIGHFSKRGWRRCCMANVRPIASLRVLFVDLDNFKQVNDGHGHVMGDRVLRECARRLADCVRDGDHVTRFGGDEFVVLLEQVKGRDEIEPVIERINSALAKPIALPGGNSFPLRSASAWRRPRRSTIRRKTCCKRRTARCTRQSASGFKSPIAMPQVVPACCYQGLHSP